MSIPEPEQSERISALRSDLKAWEKSFAAANGGRKAGREDIKQDPEVAAKYREYDRLRRPQSKKEGPKTTKTTKPTASRREEEPQSKSVSIAPPVTTPRKHKPQPDLLIPSIPQAVAEAEAEEEIAAIEPTPAAVRMRLGPTPQKDGQILGLFDCLSSGTPSNPKTRDVLAHVDANEATTPSKARRSSHIIIESPALEKARGSRTPASSGKRFLLDTFATPMKRKRDDEDNHGTPSSSMNKLETPAFLRRSNTMSIMDTLAEEGEQDEELCRLRQPAFKKRKGFAKSLSSIIMGLRKQEDDRLDEEMEIMREMEEQEAAGPPSPFDRPHEQAAVAIQVEDSQVPEVVMPLGPDQGEESEESEEDEPLNRHGGPRKAWRKKGLKRQTKRIIMRPVTHKPKIAEPQPEIAQGSGPPENDENEAPVAETQLPDTEYGSDGDFSESELRDKQTTQKQTTGAGKADASKPSQEGGPIKKAARMISASAHANFRKLKIKNQNTKANGRGRFGRR